MEQVAVVQNQGAALELAREVQLMMIRQGRRGGHERGYWACNGILLPIFAQQEVLMYFKIEEMVDFIATVQAYLGRRNKRRRSD